METIIKKLAESIESNLIHDMNCEQIGNDTAILVLNAYNSYQEDERDGVDYIFDIRKGEDLKCCIDGGMTAQEIACLNEECTKTANSTPYFMFGQNHRTAEVISTWEQLKRVLGVLLHEVVMHMISNPYVDGYKELYKHCVTDYMWNNNLV
jgi:hypothetical protein